MADEYARAHVHPSWLASGGLIMPRLRNAETGVTVSVSDGTASRLSNEWAPVQPPPAPKPAPVHPAPKKRK